MVGSELDFLPWCVYLVSITLLSLFFFPIWLFWACYFIISFWHFSPKVGGLICRDFWSNYFESNRFDSEFFKPRDCFVVVADGGLFDSISFNNKSTGGSFNKYFNTKPHSLLVRKAFSSPYPYLLMCIMDIIIIMPYPHMKIKWLN